MLLTKTFDSDFSIVFESSLSLAGVDDKYFGGVLEIECLRPVRFLSGVDPHELVSESSLDLSVVQRVQVLEHIYLVLLWLALVEEHYTDQTFLCETDIAV